MENRTKLKKNKKNTKDKVEAWDCQIGRPTEKPKYSWCHNKCKKLFYPLLFLTIVIGILYLLIGR